MRFDRRSETVERFALADIAGAFVRAGSRLALATDFGVAVVEGDRVRRHFIDRTLNGRLRVAAAEP